ncbi:unnamed protein product [Caretta caretta]
MVVVEPAQRSQQKTRQCAAPDRLAKSAPQRRACQDPEITVAGPSSDGEKESGADFSSFPKVILVSPVSLSVEQIFPVSQR